MIFWQKVLQQCLAGRGGVRSWLYSALRRTGMGVGEWTSEWVRVTIQTLTQNARMRSKENLCCQLCLFLYGRRGGGWAEGVESWTLSTVFCSSSWCLRVKPPHSSLSLSLPLPRIAYCLCTNGKHYAKTDQVLDLLVFSLSLYITREIYNFMMLVMEKFIYCGFINHWGSCGAEKRALNACSRSLKFGNFSETRDMWRCSVLT